MIDYATLRPLDWTTWSMEVVPAYLKAFAQADASPICTWLDQDEFCRAFGGLPVMVRRSPGLLQWLVGRSDSISLHPPVGQVLACTIDRVAGPGLVVEIDYDALMELVEAVREAVGPVPADLLHGLCSVDYGLPELLSRGSSPTVFSPAQCQSMARALASLSGEKTELARVLSGVFRKLEEQEGIALVRG